MKKIIFSTIVFAFIATNGANAQLTVHSNGNVSIADSSTQASSVLSVGGSYADYAVSIKGSSFGKCGLMVDASDIPSGGSEIIGIQGKCANINDNCYKIGIYGEAIQSYPDSQGRSIGVKGMAGNSLNGWNYGVCGIVEGTKNGAGVYGAVSCSYLYNTGGRYAGYFYGPTKVVGQLTTTGTINGILVGTAPCSTNSIDLIDVPLSDRLGSLQAISYYQTSTEQQESFVFGDSASTQPELSSLEKQVQERQHYGLQTDQLKEAFPELVYEQEDGTMAVNYVELIPILVQTINELNGRIQTLEGGVFKMAKATSVNDVTSEETYMLQNTPNPSNGTTSITYCIPTNTSSAEIYICDMSGQMKKSICLTEKGKSSITVSTSDLSSGIYLYSLIVNGEVCATKKMIVK